MKITNYEIILGSNSPRRAKILSEMGLSFKTRTSGENEEEIYPLHIHGKDVSYQNKHLK